MPRTFATLALALVVCLSTLGPSWAQKPALDPQLNPQKGPAAIHLNDATTLNLPAGFMFLDKNGTQTFLRQNGDPPDNSEIGVVLKPDRSWFIVISYESPGHINDDDANQLDADALFKSFQEGAKRQNEERKKMGYYPVELKGWAEQPHYDATRHHLIWALTLQANNDVSSNYFTRILGRSSYLSVELATRHIETNRKYLGTIVDAVSFNTGQRYADYQPGTDNDSGMSLTSLILGGGSVAAAAKMGIFAKLGHFIILAVLALKKVAILLVLGLVALVRKLVSRNKQTDVGMSGGAPDTSTTPPPSAGDQ